MGILNRNRRLARVAITTGMLIQSLKTGWRVVADGLPNDADYRSAWFDHERDMFWVVCASESFAEVPDGALIPEATAPVVRVREVQCPH